MCSCKVYQSTDRRETGNVELLSSPARVQTGGSLECVVVKFTSKSRQERAWKCAVVKFTSKSTDRRETGNVELLSSPARVQTGGSLECAVVKLTSKSTDRRIHLLHLTLNVEL